MRVSLQPAFVLHTRLFRDTSLLLELITLEHGRIAAISRGARRPKSHLRGLLLPFTPLLVSWSGKNELMLLSKAEPNGLAHSLSGDALLSGFYLNELLVKLFHAHDPHPELYQIYQQTISSLQRGIIQPALRAFERRLLSELGYGLQLNQDVKGREIEPDRYYQFFPDRGFVPTTSSEYVTGFLGKSLLAFHDSNLQTNTELQDAKRLMRNALQFLLAGRKLKSYELFSKMKA